MGGPGRLDMNPNFSADELALADLRTVGRYALQPFWKDGHHAGLFTYERLRLLCECDSCASEDSNRFDGMRLSG